MDYFVQRSDVFTLTLLHGEKAVKSTKLAVILVKKKKKYCVCWANESRIDARIHRVDIVTDQITIIELINN